MARARRTVRAPVRLESDDPARRLFIDDHEVEIEDASVLPLEHGGRLYEFVRRTTVGDYSGATYEAFVFSDAGSAVPETP